MSIGTVDLVATAVLHAQGKIVEMNPIMRVFIERSEWLFAFVKGLTLVIAFLAMRSYAQKNAAFVNKACWAGSTAYVAIWCAWFFGGS
jgi:CHASE2 domain-containing sensor protein